MEEVDGGEPEKEDEWVLTQEDYEGEKKDLALETEGIEEEEVEQDVEVEDIEAEEKKEEIPSKDEEIIPTEDEVKESGNPEKRTMVGHDPKFQSRYQQYKYHSILTLGQLAKRKRMK